MTDEKEFVMSLPGRRINDKEIISFNCPTNQALTDYRLVSAADSITQPRSKFKVQMLRSLQHLSTQAIQQVFTLAPKEGTYLFNYFVIFSRISSTTAWTRAAIQVQAQAWLGRFGLWRQRASAVANRKYFLHQFNRKIDKAPAAGRTKIARPILIHLSRRIDTPARELHLPPDKSVEFIVT